jgi:hypothetical protein
MGIQAGEAAVLDVATPIAQQDAAQYQQAMLANQQAANEQARFNAQQQLAAGQFDEQLGLQARQYQAQLATDVGQFNVGTAVDAAKFNTSNYSDLAKNYTQIAAGLGMQEQDLNARIGMQNAAEQNRVLGALMDIQQNRDLAMLDNNNKIEVAKINASVKGTADARAIYDNMAGRISDINQNANLTPEEADRQIQQQIALARDAINYSQHLDAIGGDFNFGGTPSGGA